MAEPPLSSAAALSEWLDLPDSQTHVMRWEFDNGTLKGRLECRSDPNADCRLTVVGFDTCECESVLVQRDELGAFHLAESPEFQGTTRLRHDMTPGPYCNIELGINDDMDMLEAYAGSFPIGETAVVVKWGGIGTGYAWEPAS